MKTIDIYAHGPTINFETIEDLKANEKVRKTLFDEHGFLKSFYIFEDLETRNPLNNRFRVGIFNGGKVASIETDTIDEMISALLDDLKVQIKQPLSEIMKITDNLRHQKYRRCKNMAEHCWIYAHSISDDCFPSDVFRRKVLLYMKWANKWAEIATKFKG